jgi:hypothetical protein
VARPGARTIMEAPAGGNRRIKKMRNRGVDNFSF